MSPNVVDLCNSYIFLILNLSGKQYFESLTRCTTISAYGVELMHHVSIYKESVAKKEAIVHKEKQRVSQSENGVHEFLFISLC